MKLLKLARKRPTIFGNELRVRYLWQPGDFNPENNFFSKLIESAGLKVKVIEDRSTFADLEIVSVFPPRLRKLLGVINSKLSIRSLGLRIESIHFQIYRTRKL